MIKTLPSGPLADICKLVESGQVVFFVGSGISLSYPACLPSAKQLVAFILSQYMPRPSPGERERILDRIWPEVLYQDLMAFIGDGALLPFKILAYPKAKPTLAHYLIVKAAASGQVPVITTNFDCLLEETARRLKLRAEVIGPSGPYWPKGAEVPIWKVHGSIGPANQSTVPSDLLATVSRITQPNVPLLRELRALFKERHVCFVGYSGSDLDLFPMIRDFSDIKTPFWVDPFPSARLDARAKSIGATLIPNTLEDILPKSLADLEAAGVSMTEFQPLTDSDAKLRTEIDDHLSLIGKEQLQHYALSPQRQRLLLAIYLNRVGDHPGALDQLYKHRAGLESGLDHADQALLLLTMARLYDCLSDYRQSEIYARSALAATKWRQPMRPNHKTISLRVQGLHALSMAKKMQLGPSFSYGAPEVDFVPSSAQNVSVLLRYILAALRMRLLLYFLRISKSDSRATIWTLSGWHWYLDHKIVLLALVEAALGRFPKLGRFAERWLLDFLHRTEIQASDRGDARILAHVQKQLQRHGFPLAADIELAFDAYDLATDPLNQALIHRNMGDSYLKDGRKRDAIAEFEKALALATQCGSKATALKALVGLYISGKKIGEADLVSRIQGLSGSGYDQFVSQFRRVLY